VPERYQHILPVHVVFLTGRHDKRRCDQLEQRYDKSAKSVPTMRENSPYLFRAGANHQALIMQNKEMAPENACCGKGSEVRDGKANAPFGKRKKCLRSRVRVSPFSYSNSVDRHYCPMLW
jgi:hypothetical protein